MAALVLGLVTSLAFAVLLGVPGMANPVYVVLLGVLWAVRWASALPLTSDETIAVREWPGDRSTVDLRRDISAFATTRNFWGGRRPSPPWRTRCVGWGPRWNRKLCPVGPRPGGRSHPRWSRGPVGFGCGRSRDLADQTSRHLPAPYSDRKSVV